MKWFCNFADQVKDRPLLLIYNGHLSHVSVKLFEKAMNENITLLKLPPHVTDKLQPLGVGCFSPLKREWDKALNERLNTIETKNSMNKSTFVEMLAKVWEKGLSSENVMSGFRATGVFPVDKKKYPVSC